MLARKRHQGKTCALGEAYREGGGRGEGGHERYAHRGALLYHLETRAARQDQRAARRIHPGAHQRADGLVERVVAADILAHQLNALVGNHPGRRVHTSGARVDRLPLRKLRDGFMELRSAHPYARADRLQCANRLLDGLLAAEPAPAAARQIASSLEQSRETLPGDGDSDLDGLFAVYHLHAPDLIRAGHQTLAQREADRVILQIRRGGEHHDVRYAMIDESDGHLLRDQIPLPRNRTSTPALDAECDGHRLSPRGLAVTFRDGILRVCRTREAIRDRHVALAASVPRSGG